MVPTIKSLYTEHVLKQREEIAISGSIREKIRFDLIDRPHYAFGLLTAADIARFYGFNKVTVIEFGVANGAGLLNLCKIAPMITDITDIEFFIYGFDNEIGLPELIDYRDHPEIWSEGDFLMDNRKELENQLPSNAKLLIGEVSNTLPIFLSELNDNSPIGFIAHDMDLYSSTKSCLNVYKERSGVLLPVSIAYFDDTIGLPGRIGSLFRNRWCGQLLAIDEFNSQNKKRKIDIIRTLKHRRPLHHALWLDQIYAVHILDSDLRNKQRRELGISISSHVSSQNFEWLL